MHRPYIGICDFTAPEQSEQMLKLLPSNFTHDLMVGVMMSRKTLLGVPTKWEHVFPKKELIAHIFVSDARALNTIHYADYEQATASDELTERLLRVLEYGGEYLRAIQLDMIWPSHYELDLFRRCHRSSIRVVLQVGRDALAQCGKDPEVVAERLRTYGDSIDTVLFDQSMGEGVLLETDKAMRYLDAIARYAPYLSLAVAGRLGPHTAHIVRPLAKRYPNLSTDMQSQMRRSGSLADPIDWELADGALREFVELFHGLKTA